MIFETSRDILNILLGFSVLLIAVMIAVLLYQFIMIIRDIRNLSKSIKEKVLLIDGLLKTSQDILHTIKDKLEHSTAYIGILIELVTRIIDHLKIKKGLDQPPLQDDHDNEESWTKDQALNFSLLDS